MSQGALSELSLPSGWTWTPLWVGAPRVQEIGMPAAEPLSVFLGVGVVPRGSRSGNHNRLGEDLAKYQVVQPGDLVFNKLRTWQGGLGASSYHGIVSPAYFVCRPGAQWHPKYLHYLLLSSMYLAELTRLSKFMPPSQFDIAWDDLRALPMMHPPVDEQRRIAAFLELEIGRIDEVERLHVELLELSHGRIDSRIRSVIGGSSLVKSNGADVTSIRRCVAKLNRPVRPSPVVVTAFRDGQVAARGLRRVEGFTEPASPEPQGQGVNVGDVVIHGLDGFAGAIGDSESEGNCSLVYHVCEPLKDGDPAFWGRLLRVLAVDGYLSLYGASARERAVDFRNWDRFGSVPVPLASLDEQHEIGEAIRSVRPLRDRVAEFKTLLGERRQALITAAVTGQIDVTTARGVDV